MTGSVFLVAFFSALSAYWLVDRVTERHASTVWLRRLGDRREASGGSSRVQPVLMKVVDEFRGKLAIHLLERLHLKRAAEQLLETAGLKWGAVGLAHRSVGMFLAGFTVITVVTGNRLPPVALAGGAGLGMLPLIYVRRKATRRVRRFEEQFPDCLEFVSRSMRAGHAFSVSLEMVHHEFSEPLSGEFRRVFEEQNLGQPLEIVLKKLSTRMPSMDVQFFVSAVLLQKRTGGNLAELLDKLAQIIRERFKLRARVRAVSAQGLMSGRILASIPLAVAALMFLVNPEYARFFVVDPMGHALVAGALGLELIGYMIIRKIVVIEI